MKLTNKFAAAFATLALTAAAQAASIPFGTIDSSTDSFQSFTIGAGSHTDLFTFTVADAGTYSFVAQAVAASGKFAFTGGELTLFGTTTESTAFDTTGSTLSEYLAAGNYTFEVQGTGAGKNGGHFTVEVSAVPEPASVALMLAGLGMIGGLARRRSTRQG